MTELIFCEKPAQAEKIASALADKAPKKKVIDKVPYYEIKHDGKDILVGCAVGHLFALAEKKKKKGWGYPVFDVEWKPAYTVKKGSEFSKKYLKVLEKLAKQADSFTVACDYDNEGSVIGFNCVRFICKQKNARRMKFSTLTKDELIESYKNASQHLDFPQIEAGETRHFLDYFWGISLSRALTLSIKAVGAFKLMSVGRVQGPALNIIVERENEIQAFKSEPYWEIELKTKNLLAQHKDGKIFDKKKVTSILRKTKDKDGVIASVKEKEFLQEPPHPFDLTTLQTESYRCFGITPKETLSIAQDLYTAGFISYPRTSSQKLPSVLGYKKIITSLGKQKEYANLCKELLKGNLKPNEGKKSDAAHPAIYPTGDIKKLTDRKKKVYDLIVRRTLATFATPAKRKTVTAEIDVNKEIFVAKGTTTIESGWHTYYGPYTNFKEEQLPNLKEKQVLKKPKIASVAKETQPPKRYTQASIIKELEKQGLGTKATRAAIVDALYQRHYLKEKSIEATQLGLTTVKTLKKYCPDILDRKLTGHFEEEMELIYEKKKKKDEILDEAKKSLEKTLKIFKKSEEKIGKELLGATRETQTEMSTIGECPECKKGDLMIKRGRFGLFAACGTYPKCKATFSLPSNALIKPTKKLCKDCNYHVVLAIRKGRRPWDYCLNKECPKKLEWIKQQEEKKNQDMEKKDGK